MKLTECTRCRLHKTRKQVVLGKGNKRAKIMLIGQNPGRSEDEKGEPFVGAAGKLLDGMLRRIGLDRKSIYITNINKCWTPDNREPMEDEVEACNVWLGLELEKIKPALIVTLGRFAGNVMLENDESMGEMENQLVYTPKFKCYIFPIMHPAAALHQADRKEALADSFDKLKKIINSEVKL